jgi:hypothetical protein
VVHGIIHAAILEDERLNENMQQMIKTTMLAPGLIKKEANKIAKEIKEDGKELVHHRSRGSAIQRVQV